MPKKDLEDMLGWFFRKTLLLWLFPYILWFFGKKIYRVLHDWLTEPERGSGQGT